MTVFYVRCAHAVSVQSSCRLKKTTPPFIIYYIRLRRLLQVWVLLRLLRRNTDQKRHNTEGRVLDETYDTGHDRTTTNTRVVGLVDY